MSFFKKEKVFNDGFVINYYDGGLEGFEVNMPCNLLLENSTLYIRRINPKITVELASARIKSIDIFLKETDYMAKYRGHTGSTSKSNIQKVYFVINYISQNGDIRHLDFWGTALNIKKINELKSELFTNDSERTYSL